LAPPFEAATFLGAIESRKITKKLKDLKKKRKENLWVQRSRSNVMVAKKEDSPLLYGQKVTLHLPDATLVKMPRPSRLEI